MTALHSGFHIAAGTSFMWARENFFEAVDYLFVDEAGQLSLIDTVALSHAGKEPGLTWRPAAIETTAKGKSPGRH